MTVWSEIDAVYLLCHPEKESSRWQRLCEHLAQRGVPSDKLVCIGKTWGDQLDETMPEAFAELTKIYKKLESHYRDMQDIEFIKPLVAKLLVPSARAVP